MLLWIAGLSVVFPALAGATGAQPTAAIIGTGLLVAGLVTAGWGLVLESLHRSRTEQKRILFLAVPALGVQ